MYVHGATPDRMRRMSYENMIRGKPRGPAQRAAPLCMPQKQEVVHSLQVCHAERHRAAAPGVAGREPYHIPFDQEKN